MPMTTKQAGEMLRRAANVLYNKHLYGSGWNGVGDSKAVDLLDQLAEELNPSRRVCTESEIAQDIAALTPEERAAWDRLPKPSNATVTYDSNAQCWLVTWPTGEVECWGDEDQAREAATLEPGEAPQL